MARSDCAEVQRGDALAKGPEPCALCLRLACPKPEVMKPAHQERPFFLSLETPSPPMA